MRDDDDVRGTETRGELFEQESCAAVLVWLEDADEALGFFMGSQRAEELCLQIPTSWPRCGQSCTETRFTPSPQHLLAMTMA